MIALARLFEPTIYLPRTPMKVDVLAKRVARRQPLWHPEDATCEGEWELVTRRQSDAVIVLGQRNKVTGEVILSDLQYLPRPARRAMA